MAIKWKLSPKQHIKHFSTGVETATKHHHLSKSPPPMVASSFAQVQYYPTEKEERKRKKHYTTDWLVVTNSETSCRSWGWKLAEIWQKKTFAFVTMRLNNYDAVKRRVGDWQRYENNAFHTAKINSTIALMWLDAVQIGVLGGNWAAYLTWKAGAPLDCQSSPRTGPPPPDCHKFREFSLSSLTNYAAQSPNPTSDRGRDLRNRKRGTHG